MTMPFPFEYPEGLQTFLSWAHWAEGGFTTLEQHQRLPHLGSLPSSCAFSIPACWNPGSQAVGKLYKGKQTTFVQKNQVAFLVLGPCLCDLEAGEPTSLSCSFLSSSMKAIPPALITS